MVSEGEGYSTDLRRVINVGDHWGVIEAIGFSWGALTAWPGNLIIERFWRPICVGEVRYSAWVGGSDVRQRRPVPILPVRSLPRATSRTRPCPHPRPRTPGQNGSRERGFGTVTQDRSIGKVEPWVLAVAVAVVWVGLFVALIVTFGKLKGLKGILIRQNTVW